MRRIIFMTGFLVFALCACQGASARQQVTKGDELAFYNFSAPGTFEEGTYDGATLRVNDGVYRIDVHQGDNSLWWGQWGDTYDNVVIDVDINQITQRNENAYGVMCRVRGTVGQPHEVDPDLAAIMEETSEPIEATLEATEPADEEETATEEAATPEVEQTEVAAEETVEATERATEEPSFSDGDGYLFLIQGTGSFAIMRARGRNVVPLVDWTVSDHITVGPGRNHIRAVCSGTYLAMYVNDQFVGDAIDDTYSSGQVGLVASAANQLGVRVEFDDLTISEPVTG